MRVLTKQEKHQRPQIGTQLTPKGDTRIHIFIGFAKN